MDGTAKALAGAPDNAEATAADTALLARDIRALRRSRNLTLSELADQLGRSVGWLSQVERGISVASINDLRAVCRALEVPISLLFAHEPATEAERGVVVRAGRRRPLGSSDSGLTEELLSPDLGGSFEMVRSVFAPGAELEQPQQRDTEEAAYVVSGHFDIEIDGAWHQLGPGDSFRFDRKRHRWRNTGETEAVLVWVIAPPVY
ncbi:MAG: XRE family transcriptional regulator [Rhizobiaceae bacterium]